MVDYRGGMDKPHSNRLLVVAMVVFAIGLAALIALLVITQFTDATASQYLYALTMCAPLGFLLGLIAALRAGRRAR